MLGQVSSVLGQVSQSLVWDRVNISEKDENSALSMAVGNGNYDVVKCLLEFFADPNTTNKKGMSPIARARKLATLRSRQGMTRLLLMHNADDVKGDDLGWTKPPPRSGTCQAHKYSKRESSGWQGGGSSEGWQGGGGSSGSWQVGGSSGSWQGGGGGGASGSWQGGGGGTSGSWQGGGGFSGSWEGQGW